jgi:hypothetical protein
MAAEEKAIPDNQIILRFYGRFVYAVPKAADRILALAPNFEEAKFGEHKPLMSVQRDQVIFTNNNTTLKPMLRLATDASILNGEFLVWDMSGYNIAYDIPDGPVSLTAETGVVLKLPEMAGVNNATINPLALEARKTGPSRTVIKINAGTGVAKPVVDHSKVSFVTDRDMQKFPNDPAKVPHVKDPNNSTKDREESPADLVEFVVTSPAPATAGPFSLSFTFVDAAGNDAGKVQVRGGTKITFSNMCATISPGVQPFDLEFREYYNLLSSSGPDRLVPAAPLDNNGSLIEGADCDLQSMISF